MSNPEIDSKGNKWWYNSDDELHREEGPAVEYFDGDRFWFLHGRFSRLDGPAVEYADGTEGEWWVEGVEVTEKEYPQTVLIYKCKQVLES